VVVVETERALSRQKRTRQALKGIPPHGVGTGARHRKVLSKHAAFATEGIDAGFDVRAPIVGSSPERCRQRPERWYRAPLNDIQVPKA